MRYRITFTVIDEWIREYATFSHRASLTFGHVNSMRHAESRFLLTDACFDVHLLRFIIYVTYVNGGDCFSKHI